MPESKLACLIAPSALKTRRSGTYVCYGVLRVFGVERYFAGRGISRERRETWIAYDTSRSAALTTR